MNKLQITQFTTITIIIIIIIIINIIQVIWDVTYCIATTPLRPSNPGLYVCEKTSCNSSERITTIFNIQAVCDIACNVRQATAKPPTPAVHHCLLVHGLAGVGV
jgi:phosphoglucomutase